MSGKVLEHGVVQQVPINEIDESPFQVRLGYGDIEGLAQDIKKRGLLQPILLRPIDKRYEIVHGHRRFRATKSLGNKFILGMIRELDDESAMLIHGSENIQRKALSPIEQGKLYSTIMERFNKTISKVARDFSASLEAIRSHINLLSLPDDIQAKVHSGEIPYSKARQLTILTRKPTTPSGVVGKKKFQPAPRTDEHFIAIREITESPSLKTEREVAETAKLVREGATVPEAIKKVKQETQRKQVEKGGRTPEEMAKLLKQSDFDEKAITKARLKAYKTIVLELLNRELLTCPECHENKLSWSCCGRDFE